jgi:uncharacterized protein YbjT (DUF2867 family)
MILVTGATGLNGSAVIRGFVRQCEPVRALVRSAAKAASLGSSAVVEVVEGDMRDEATLAAALDGVDRVLMISSADGWLGETQRSFIDAAHRARVEHVVKFSGLGVALDSGFRFTRIHAEIERYLEQSGSPGRTCVRASSCRCASAKRRPSRGNERSTCGLGLHVSPRSTSRTSPRRPSLSCTETVTRASATR